MIGRWARPIRSLKNVDGIADTIRTSQIVRAEMEASTCWTGRRTRSVRVAVEIDKGGVRSCLILFSGNFYPEFIFPSEDTSE